MIKKPVYKFFISSVIEGFTAERDKVADVITRNEHVPLLSEKWLGDKPSRKLIEEKIAESDCYIGIFHKRWGWIPEDNNPKKLSVTALECETAKEIGLPYLLLVSNEEKEEPLKKYLDSIGDFETGDWLHHYDDTATMTGIVGSMLQTLIKKIEQKPSTPSQLFTILNEHNEKYKALIKDTINNTYEKPIGLDKILENIIGKNTWFIGARGIGKSVTLRKVLDHLEKKHVNVLFLRAEEIHSKHDFQNITKDEFGLSLIELIKLITKKQEIYLIIDSIEAIQRNQESWASFSAELPSLQKMDRVHTILAIRKSDYDAFPYVFKKEWGNEIIVEGFSLTQVKKFLKKLKIKSKIDNKLYEILKTPFYLDLFVSIVSKGKLTKFSTITNQYQFLREHYNRVIRNNDQELELADQKVELLNKIANKMLERKRFKISNASFPATPAFSSLRSDGVIIDNNDFIEFFHQVYFDFIMSIQITNAGLISNFLQNVGAELFLHSTVYFTLAYLRTTDLEEFISNVDNILISNNVSYYWKRVTLEFFASLPNATNKEISVIETRLRNDSSLQVSFLEYVIEKQNPIWYHYWSKTLFNEWSRDEKFLNGSLLSKYIAISMGVKK